MVLGAGFGQRTRSVIRVACASSRSMHRRRRRGSEDAWPSSDSNAAVQLSLVPVDFEAGESWLAEAVEAGLDPASPVVVSMLGVTMYLTREAVLATLRQAASLPPGSTTVFTYSRLHRDGTAGGAPLP